MRLSNLIWLILNFFKYESNVSLFIFTYKAVTIYILMYVDDILITGNYLNLVEHVINSLAGRFSPKNLGELNYFLGIEVKHVLNEIAYHRPNTFLRFSMEDCKWVATLMCSSSPHRTDDGSSLSMQFCINAFWISCNIYHSRILILLLQ